MIEYTGIIEEQIKARLDREGSIGVDGLPGIDETDAASMLLHYSRTHAERMLCFDGHVLTTGGSRAEPPHTQVPSRVTPSPVDQVLAAPRGKALLDSAPAGPPVSRTFWLLPLSLGALGGLISWFAVRDRNPRAARSLLIFGIIVQLLTLWASFSLADKVGGVDDLLHRSGAVTSRAVGVD